MNARHVALITGGSGGIGAAIARRLAADGLGVVIAGRRLAACEELAAELEAAGGWARPLVLDLEAPDELPDRVEAARALAADFGALDRLVNNAGVAESASALPRAGSEQQHEAAVRRHLEVNFHGARRLGELCAPAMLAAGEGAIAQVVSSAGLAGYAYVSAYCASKHALLGYSRALADELGPKGVRVSCVCPHYVDSPMLRASIERVMAKTGQSEAEARAFFVGQNPGGALVTTEQVAATVAELLADEDGGRVVELDGGPAKEIA